MIIDRVLTQCDLRRAGLPLRTHERSFVESKCFCQTDDHPSLIVSMVMVAQQEIPNPPAEAEESGCDFGFSELASRT